MAGKKQHHIPRSVQRGFLFDAKSEKTYVHRRGGGIFPKAIGDVAAQRFFYSQLSSDGSKTLDDEITEYENRLGRLLVKLRAAPIDSSVEAEEAAEIIAHLTPRTANMRRILGSGMAQLMTAASEAFSDEETVVNMLGLAELEPNNRWNEHLTRFIEEDQNLKTMLEQFPVPKTLLDRLIFMGAKEHFTGTYDANSLGIMQFFATFRNGLDDMVRDSHNKALGSGPFAELRKTSLAALNWHIRSAPPVGALLPDCVAIGVDQEGGTFLPYMMTQCTTVSAVVMPLTSDKLLVGLRSGHALPDLANFNHDGAACCDELFITASQAPIFAELHAKMGERWIGEIDTFVQGALQDLLPNKKLIENSVNQLPPLPMPSYQLTFLGYGEIDTTPISEKTQYLVEKIRAIFDLSRLDGITFASPFQQGLDELDRGFDVNTTPEGIPDLLAQGVSTAIVMRDGGPMLRIIINAEYGLAFAGEEQRDAEVALHLLAAGLAQACTLAQIEKALPGFLMKPVMMNDHDAVLHCAARRALRAYRYAHDSAGFGANELVEQEFSKYVLSSYERATAAITKARADHAANENYPALFEAAHEAASDMLISMARLIGHRHGTGQFETPSADTEVGTAMASRHLTKWVEVFAKDLQRFWQKEIWTQADFYGFNIHVERVMWANGIVVWQDESGISKIMAAPQALKF